MSDWNTKFPDDRLCMRLLGLPVPLPFDLDPAVAAVENTSNLDQPHVVALRSSLVDQARRVIAGLAADERNNIAVSRVFDADDDFRVARRSGGCGVRIDLVAFGAFCRTRHDTDRLTELHRLVHVGNLN